MDKLLYLSDDFAIMERGAQSKYAPEKELKSLFDLHPSKPRYKKDLEKFLTLYGSRYDYGGNFLEFRPRDIDDLPMIRSLGFNVSEIDGYDRFLISGKGGGTGDRFLVCIQSTDSEAGEFDGDNPQRGSISAIRGSLAYLARLGLFSQGKADAPPFTKLLFSHYRFHAPPYLCHHIDYPEDGTKPIYLSGVYDDRVTQFPGRVSQVVVASTKTETALDSSAPLLNQGYPTPADKEKMAAFLLFLTLCEHFKGGVPRYNIDTKNMTFEIRGNLAETLRDCIMRGDVKLCEGCGEPLMGRALFCRNTRCQTNYNERAKREIIKNGYDRIQAGERFPAIKSTTLDKWFDKEMKV